MVPECVFLFCALAYERIFFCRIIIKIIANRADAHQPFGGIKVETEMGWFAARPSGTEDVYKVYAESFRDQSHLNRIQNEAQDAIAQIF